MHIYKYIRYESFICIYRISITELRQILLKNSSINPLHSCLRNSTSTAAVIIRLTELLWFCFIQFVLDLFSPNLLSLGWVIQSTICADDRSSFLMSAEIKKFACKMQPEVRSCHQQKPRSYKSLLRVPAFIFNNYIDPLMKVFMGSLISIFRSLINLFRIVSLHWNVYMCHVVICSLHFVIYTEKLLGSFPLLSNGIARSMELLKEDYFYAYCMKYNVLFQRIPPRVFHMTIQNRLENEAIG